MVFRKAITVVVVAVICRYIYFFLVKYGVGVHYNEHFPGDCRVIPGIECGSEKISVAKKNAGLAFIANGLRVLTNCNPNLISGSIFMFDFNKPSEGAKRLVIKSESSLEDFEPHGMDLLELKDGTIDLYVINHAKHQETVEVFRYNLDQPDLLKHLRTIRNEQFACLNDLTMIGEDQFYITKWVRYCTYPSFFVMIELFLALNTSSIVLYDHGKTTVVAIGPGYNGITQSVVNKEIVAVPCSTTFLHVFEKLEGGGLKLKEEIDIGNFGDNIYTDPKTGDYFVGVQKKYFRLIAAAKNQTKAAVPSSAVRFYRTADGKNAVEEIMHDSGRSFIQCVSSAVHYNGQYLFGSIFHKLLYCNTTNV